MQLLDPYHQACLFPQAFQVIVVTQLGVKDMNDDRAEIDQDPTRVGRAFYVQAARTSSAGPIFDLIENGPELRFAFCIAYDKVVGQQRHLLHIQNDNVGAKSFGNGIHDQMSEFNWFQDCASTEKDSLDHLSLFRSASSRSSIRCQCVPCQ